MGPSVPDKYPDGVGPNRGADDGGGHWWLIPVALGLALTVAIVCGFDNARAEADASSDRALYWATANQLPAPREARCDAFGDCTLYSGGLTDRKRWRLDCSVTSGCVLLGVTP
jgi:hypothetical protein